MNPLFREKVENAGHQIQKQEWTKNLKYGIWMGETGGAYNSGRNTITNRFMSAFWYLDWLGTLSVYGHKAFCRQTLLGGNYGLLQNENGKIRPNPDFWGAIMFNSLMKGAISNATSNNQNIHIYVASNIANMTHNTQSSSTCAQLCFIFSHSLGTNLRNKK